MVGENGVRIVHSACYGGEPMDFPVKGKLLSYGPVSLSVRGEGGTFGI